MDPRRAHRSDDSGLGDVRLGHPDLVSIALRVPTGVLCLISALSLHDLTTQIPHEIYLTLPRGADPPRLGHPPVRPFWCTGKAFVEGIETHALDGIDVRVSASSHADRFVLKGALRLWGSPTSSSRP